MAITRKIKKELSAAALEKIKKKFKIRECFVKIYRVKITGIFKLFVFFV